ncbi:MAG TPA: DUF2516 family protein [Marmoricola sp.]|nr:DUF2516 family protein [Marmoricola sp.]
MHAFDFESGVLGVLFLVLAAVKAWALIDAVARPTPAFTAADKLTKPAWLWILGLSLVAHIVFSYPIGLLSIAGTIAAFVYLLDVRPAVASVTRRR